MKEIIIAERQSISHSSLLKEVFSCFSGESFLNLTSFKKTMMDYKALLIKYMAHLHELEGSDYTDDINGPFNLQIIFTEQEKQELLALSLLVENYSDNKSIA